ncbi:class I SAM-dependent methyltransferase [Acidiphilium sp.]|uniref:class I SAM-dependent methyltransferase n=1 Tax=Acidiphilium sp. TaxID=527 RepID=UPI003CFE764C
MPDMTQTTQDTRRTTNRQYLTTVVTPTPGWLYDFTALCTMDLLDQQEESGWSGSLLEIGVYGGKFCSILARDAFRRGSHLVGIDPFTHFDIADIRNRLNTLPVDRRRGLDSDEIVTLVADLSLNWTPDRLLATLKDRARFLHIDGSHSKEDVLWDLALCDAVLAPHGIIAVDDWLNTQCLSVMEATFEFFRYQPRASVAFAVVPGKLLLCGRGQVKLYQERLEQFALLDQTYEQSTRYRQRAGMLDSGFRQKLWGTEIIVLL